MAGWPPKKNAAFNLTVCLYTTAGALVTNPGTITAKISKDYGDYADIGTVTEEDSTYGQIKLALTNTEMNADVIDLYIVDNTSGCIPFTCTILTDTATIGEVNTDADAILADTNELQTDWTNGGRLDLIVDAILADTNELQTDDTPGALTTISGKIDTIDDFLDTEVAAILADTNELQTDWTNGGRLDLLLDATLADTNELQTDLVNGGRLDLIFDAILADTNELQTDDTPGAIAAVDAKIDTIDGIVDAILVDTGTTLQGEVDGIQAQAETLLKALVYKQIITEANGNTELFDSSNASLGTVNTAFSSDGTYTTRLKLVI